MLFSMSKVSNLAQMTVSLAKAYLATWFVTIVTVKIKINAKLLYLGYCKNEPPENSDEKQSFIYSPLTPKYETATCNFKSGCKISKKWKDTLNILVEETKS